MGGWLDGWMDGSPVGVLPDLCASLSGNDRTESPADPRSDHWITDPAVSQWSVSQSVSRAAWSLPSVFSDTNAPVRLTAWRSVGGGVMLRRAAFPPTVSRRAATLAAGCRR